MTHEQPPAPIHAAEVAREYVPDGEGQIHGVTFDGKSVWFARDDEVVAFDPITGTIVRRFAIPGAGAGTAWDGERLYQLAGGEILVIDPSDGQIVRRLPSPGKGEDSGMAWSDGYLWVGQCYGARIHKVDAATGEVVKTLTSDRFVTGVTCVDGQLWHGAAFDDKPAELRRLAADGTPEEVLSVPVAAIAGVEAAGDGSFWCAGERGKLRLVRRTSEG